MCIIHSTCRPRGIHYWPARVPNCTRRTISDYSFIFFFLEINNPFLLVSKTQVSFHQISRRSNIGTDDLFTTRFVRDFLAAVSIETATRGPKTRCRRLRADVFFSFRFFFSHSAHEKSDLFLDPGLLLIETLSRMIVIVSTRDPRTTYPASWTSACSCCRPPSAARPRASSRSSRADSCFPRRSLWPCTANRPRGDPRISDSRCSIPARWAGTRCSTCRLRCPCTGSPLCWDPRWRATVRRSLRITTRNNSCYHNDIEMSVS